MNKIPVFLGTDDYDPSVLGHEELNKIEKNSLNKQFWRAFHVLDPFGGRDTAEEKIKYFLELTCQRKRYAINNLMKNKR